MTTSIVLNRDRGFTKHDAGNSPQLVVVFFYFILLLLLFFF